MTPRLRRTVMYFPLGPLGGDKYWWLHVWYKMKEDVGKLLCYRVARKSRGCETMRIECRRLPPKWHDRSGCSGMIEAVATWEEA
jgi:hypothetical protein